MKAKILTIMFCTLFIIACSTNSTEEKILTTTDIVDCKSTGKLVYEDTNESNKIVDNINKAKNVFWEYKIRDFDNINPVFEDVDPKKIEIIPYQTIIDKKVVNGWIPVPYGGLVNNSEGESVLLGIFVSNNAGIYSFEC